VEYKRVAKMLEAKVIAIRFTFFDTASGITDHIIRIHMIYYLILIMDLIVCLEEIWSYLIVKLFLRLIS
jgi:hypothetical protein